MERPATSLWPAHAMGLDLLPSVAGRQVDVRGNAPPRGGSRAWRSPKSAETGNGEGGRARNASP